MNLNIATTEQLDAYKIKVAGILKLDPDMLDYIWVYDAFSGLRNQVLYAKRGAAEVIREQRNISVLSLTSYEGQGWVMFTAVGNIPSGRQEIAVGAAYVEGHRHDKKAHAVMTAQTRAVRRLTLQFVGGGILDETEVQTQEELMAQPAASQATLAGSPVVIPTIPTVAPATAPGRDITPLHPGDAQFVGEKEQIDAALAQQIAKETARIQAAEVVTALVPTTSTEPEVATKTTKVRPPRKPKNTVSLAEPSSANVETLLKEQFTAEQVSAPALAEVVPTPPRLAEQVQPVPQVQVQAAPPKADIPADKNAEYKAKVKTYQNDILVQGGMKPSAGIGGISMKFRRYAIVSMGVADTTQLTTEQWEKLFAFLDGFTAQFGPVELVKLIDQKIGAVQA